MTKKSTKTNTIISEETANLLFSIKAITLSPQKPYRFTSGMLSPIYLDNRLIISHPKVRNKIVNFYLNLINKEIGYKNIDYVSGTATAAIANAMFVAQKLKKPMVYVEVNKGEIHKSKVVGKLKKNKHVLVIEDHITTAGSLVGNVLAIRNFGGIVNRCIVTTTYRMKQAEKFFKKYQVKVYHLTDIHSILDIAIKNGYLKKKERKLIEEWVSDPVGWGKKMGFE